MLRKTKEIFSFLFIFFMATGALLWGDAVNERWKMRAVNLPSATRPIVILDPGHGGIDGGATGNSITEKEINLQVAKNTAALCEFFGFDVIKFVDRTYYIS